MTSWALNFIQPWTIDQAQGFIVNQGSAFTPASISGLGAWYDATDASSFTFSTGADVSQWNDKSGNGNNLTQSTGTLQPLRVASGINSMAAVQFRDDGTAKMVAAVHSASLTWTTAVHSFVVMRRVADLAASEHVVGLYAASGTEREWRLLILSDDVLQMTASTNGMAGGLVSVNNATALSLSTNYILEGTANTVTQLVGSSVNNATPATASGFTAHVNSNAPFNVGARNGASDPYAGYVGEIVFYTKSLTAGERTQVINYLSAKWGIAV